MPDRVYVWLWVEEEEEGRVEEGGFVGVGVAEGGRMICLRVVEACVLRDDDGLLFRDVDVDEGERDDVEWVVDDLWSSFLEVDVLLVGLDVEVDDGVLVIDVLRLVVDLAPRLSASKKDDSGEATSLWTTFCCGSTCVIMRRSAVSVP